MDRFTTTTRFIDAKTDIRDRISVEVGDSKEAAFMPQTKVMRWNNEVNLSVRLVHDETRVTVEETGGLVKWRGERREAHFYELPASDLLPEGGTEVEILLLERPLTNVVRFTLNTKGLAFHKQELTENLRTLGVEQLAEHIDGSYAVYCDTPKTNYTTGNLYRSGKVGHIYRPWIVDANGNGVWGELNVDTVRGILAVRIPQAFLDSAAYPVRHAAGLTFGYTTTGATGYFTYADAIILQKGTAASAGVIEKYSFYTDSPLYGVYQNDSCRFGLYSSDHTTLIDSAAEVTTGTFTGWYDVNSATTASVAASTDYYIALWSDNNNGGIGAAVAYDLGGPELSRVDAETYGTLTAWPEPHAWTTLGGNYLFSMYVTYTEAAGGLPLPFRTRQAVNRASFY